MTYTRNASRSYNPQDAKVLEKFYLPPRPLMSQSMSSKVGTSEEKLTHLKISVDPLVAKILDEEQEKDEKIYESNTAPLLMETLRRMDSGILESSHGMMVWKRALVKGRSPIESDFATTVDGSRSVWPPAPLFSCLVEVASSLQLPRLAMRHPETIPMILRSILRNTIEYARMQTGEQKNIEGQRSTLRTDDENDDEEDYQHDPHFHHLEDENEDDIQDDDSLSPSDFTNDVSKFARVIAERLVEEWSEVVEGVILLDDIFGFDHDFLSSGEDEDNDGGSTGATVGFGIQDGIWSHTGWRLIPTLQKQISAIPELKDLMQDLGRRPSAEEYGANDRRFEKFAPRRSHPEGAMGAEIDRSFCREAVTGIALSGNPSEMLPSEAVLLRQRLAVNEEGKTYPNMLRRLFLAKMAESKLQSYELSGWTDVPSIPKRDPLYLNRLPSAPGGPIILCLDTSWSMSGNRETLSKAVVLACVGEAHRQGRNCEVISFSTERQVMETGVITADSDGIRRLLEFLLHSFGGGTDVTGALKFAIDALHGERKEKSTGAKRISADNSSDYLSMEAADILLVTDGEIPDPPVPREVMSSIERLRDLKGVKIHGLLVGKKESKPLSELCTHTHDFLSRYVIPAAVPTAGLATQTTPINSIRRRDRTSATTLYAKRSHYDDYEEKEYGQKVRKRKNGKRKSDRYDEGYEENTTSWTTSVNKNLQDENTGSESTENNQKKNTPFRARIDEELCLLKEAAANAIAEDLWTVQRLNEERKENEKCWEAHKHLNAAVARVEAGLVERGEDARLVVLAMIANEHILLIGKPGTGKSVLGLRLAELCDGAFFQRLLTRFTTPEELFGPLSLKSLENDEYRRVTSGFLPTADVAFLDEIFKANSAILNTLLTVLNERKFDNGGRRESCPIRCVVGASNELPDSDELVALYDRFLIRKEVVTVTDEGVLQLLSMSNEIDNDGNRDAPFVGDLDGIIKSLSLASDSVLMDDDACGLMRDMRASLRDDHDIEISDRRLVKATRLLKISAASDGRKKVDTLDFLLLQHCFWNEPSQRVTIREWLWDNLTPSDRSTDVSPNQLRFLLENLRKEILSVLRKTNGCVDGSLGANPGDVASLEALRDECERISRILNQRLDALARHMELIRRSMDFTWIEPDDANAIRQMLLPRAELLWPQMMKLAEDAEALGTAISRENQLAITNEFRRDVIELLWDDGATSVRDFTEDELQLSMREAKSKYELETFRRWKRAKKKYDKASN
eukprot:CAMPEP_0197197348 /NCGR_PEP_ID=MMETSP1423-20130617/32820_1 /TAXON_ID=476441 /ORGANISM="Pseudo-nitzschia heimii, Strain UNC1101" /LENGTH=1252 /DNA_ID=CAMNT_0042651169 /DNA_START=207 /DNA_END=3965 /DNA_ORIENTATION=+